MPTNKIPIVVITSTIAIMAAACVGTICFLAYKGIEVPPELNTLTGGLVGALTAMLVKTSPTETTKQPDVPLPTPLSVGGAIDVKVVNKPKDSVPTIESNPTEPKE